MTSQTNLKERKMDFKNLPKAQHQPSETPETIYVPKEKFERIGLDIQVQNISEKHKVTETFFHLKSEYVTTGAYGTGTGYGWRSIDAHEVIDVARYDGVLEPKPYNEHNWLVDAGKRPRGYIGMTVRYKKRNLVLFKKVIFKPLESEAGKQTKLF